MSVLSRESVAEILQTTETFRLERTVSTSDTDKFCEAICAFANDMPDSRQNGYLFIGVTNDGRRSGLKVTDKLLKDLASIRSDGNILPMPVMNVSHVSFDDGDVIVIEVEPSNFPPVRYRGRTIFRVQVPAASSAGQTRFAAIQSAKSVLTESISTLSAKKSAHIQRVFDILCENDQITIGALSDALSLSRTAIVEDINYLKSLGLLTRIGGTRGHWQVTVSPTPTPKPYTSSPTPTPTPTPQPSPLNPQPSTRSTRLTPLSHPYPYT